MQPGTEILLLLVAAMAVGLGIVFHIGEQELAQQEPTPVSRLTEIAILAGHNDWTITILRRSGYHHALFELTGSASSAIQLGQEKLRQARILDIIIIENRADILEVRAFYESTGTRRTGKYVGGFRICKS